MKIFDYLRDYKFGIFNPHWWRDFWYSQISSRLRPRNRWLTTKISRTWQDKDTILQTVALECLKHYVDPEGEDCFHTLCTTDPPEQAAFLKEVKYYYDLTTINLPALQTEMDAEWDKVPLTDLSVVDVTKLDYEARYGKINRLEKEIHDLQTKIMVWIVVHRSLLWT